MSEQKNTEPKIYRARCDSLTMYEVMEDELSILEKGSPNGIFLNFAIFAFSAAISLGATLLSVEIDNDKVFSAFLCLCVLGVFSGTILIILWWKSKDNFSETIKKIRARNKDEDIKSCPVDPTTTENPPE